MMKRRDLLVAHFKKLIADLGEDESVCTKRSTVYGRRRATMMRRPLVGGGNLEQPLVVPHPAQETKCRRDTARR